MTSCVSRKYRRAQSIAKLVLTLDNIVFIDTQVSKKVSVRHRSGQRRLERYRRYSTFSSAALSQETERRVDHEESSGDQDSGTLSCPKLHPDLT